jgi:flagellin-specific chaperone FliS
MEAGQIREKGEALSKAINIIDNGLKAGLNMEVESELSGNLAPCTNIWFDVCCWRMSVTT